MRDKQWTRYIQIMSVVALLFVILAVRLVIITTVEHDNWTEASENLSVKAVSISAPRGQIFDRYGRLLAGNLQTFSVLFSSTNLSNDQVNDVSLELVKIFERNGDEYNDNFPIVQDEAGNLVYTYTQEIEAWLKSEGMPPETTAEEAFARLRTTYEIDETYDVYEAQEYLQNIYKVYPPISVRVMEFTANVAKKNFLEKYNMDAGTSAEDAFRQLREKYKLPLWMTRNDARRIMVVRDAIADMGYNQYISATIATGISDKTIIEIEERSKDLPGVDVVSESVRYYPNGSVASHILGYMGKISEANKARYVDELGYGANDLIGQSGLEASFESTLKGDDGVEYVQVNARGRKVKTVSREEPKKGQDIYTTIDLDLQMVAEKALTQALEQIQVGGTFESEYGNYKYTTPYKNATVGATVAIEVESGEVLAMASAPDFDPNLFSLGISSADWQALQSQNPRDSLAPAPLYNVAARSSIQPGSTFKMVTATAALDQGLDPYQKLRDDGYITVGNRNYNCLVYTLSHTTHGYIDLAHAIEVSCNYYFYDVATGKDYSSGRSLGYSLNIDKIMEYARQYGLGEPTGIEITETVSSLPSAERKMKTQKTLLKYHLNANAEKYFKTKVLADPEALAADIDEIVSWMDENPSRNTVIARMADVGVKDDMIETLADLCKYTYFNFAAWTLGDEFNIAIGQGENAYTPLQMANYVATIANDGKHNKATLISAIEGETEIVREEATSVDITESHLKEITKGMNLVAQGSRGSLRGIFGSFPVKVAAKSGTADKEGKINWPSEVEYVQTYLSKIAPNLAWEDIEAEMYRLMEEYPETYTGADLAVRRALINLSDGKITTADIDRFKDDYDPFAWVVCFAPADDPKIAVATLIFQGGKAAYAAPVAREIIGAYLKVGSDYEDYSLETVLR